MYKYIIVDDEQLIRKGIHLKVIELGLPLTLVGEAEDGEEALGLIDDQHPDIVLTDMRMPVVDGVHFLKRLIEDYPAIKIIVISGYSDFEYMSQAIASRVIGYVLKPFDSQELRACMENAILSIQNDTGSKKQREMELYRQDVNSLFNAMVTGKSDETAGTVGMKSHELQVLNASCRYYAALLYADPEAAPDHEYVDKLQQQLNPCLVIPHPLHSNMIVLLLYERRGDIGRFQPAERANKTIVAALAAADIQGAVGFSSEKAVLSALHDAYMEAVQSLNFRPMQSAESFFSYDAGSAGANQAESPDGAWANEGNLLFFIEAGNKEQAVTYAHDLFLFYAKQPHARLFQAKQYCKKLIMNIQLSPDQPNAANFLDESIEAIQNCLGPEALRKVFARIVSEAAARFTARNVQPSEALAHNIKKYIEQNYHRPLTLEMVSSLFFIHPVYCSILFKEKMGENFQDYIKRIRIDQAKRLLRNTPHKIERIAQLTGYDNTKYFYRVFRKEVGVSPAEFRNHV